MTVVTTTNIRCSGRWKPKFTVASVYVNLRQPASVLRRKIGTFQRQLRTSVPVHVRIMSASVSGSEWAAMTRVHSDTRNLPLADWEFLPVGCLLFKPAKILIMAMGLRFSPPSKSGPLQLIPSHGPEPGIYLSFAPLLQSPAMINTVYVALFLCTKRKADEQVEGEKVGKRAKKARIAGEKKRTNPTPRRLRSGKAR
ncbi:hypothetical protein B0H17DRAFT_1140021 [Mycena rosella]|uniref:Uncharacterized protein n=1 Tax=Mycena rosella TaxID=1033263 RepID=A0AAD7D3G4_MYCRO|nr:hypothetical protein B0H17DRAFT_1140021 [Mycena rosella]